MADPAYQAVYDYPCGPRTPSESIDNQPSSSSPFPIQRPTTDKSKDLSLGEIKIWIETEEFPTHNNDDAGKQQKRSKHKPAASTIKDIKYEKIIQDYEEESGYLQSELEREKARQHKHSDGQSCPDNLEVSRF